jgi:predicted dehydrogenase
MFGAGDFGPQFARYVAEVGEVVAVCDPSPAGRARFHNAGLHVPEFADTERLLAETDLDAVAITSPNHTHKEITLAAARLGKHVYCEKAMAPSVPDCWEMVRACQKAGVRLMVGHKRRLRPPWARMIELREELGPVRAIDVCLYFDARPYDFHGWWTRAEQSGGTLDVAGVHTIDWMRAMCGDVAAVTAIAGPQIDRRYDFPDNLHVLLSFRSGAVASPAVSLSYPLLKFRVSNGPAVVCQGGGMRFFPYLTPIDLFWQRFQDSGKRHEHFDDLGFDHAFRKEIADFVQWITEGTQPCLTWREGLRCVEIMEAAHRSAKEGGGRRCGCRSIRNSNRRTQRRRERRRHE